MPKSVPVAAMIGLNALPIYGVIVWGWQSFDLIFLYWLENLIIGVFTLLRFLVRPYRHRMDLVLPLFFAPFFAFHYGMFSLGHGSFIFSLFGPEGIDSRGFTDVIWQIWPVLQDNHLFWAAACLLLLQLLDWLREIRKKGLGADGVRALMVAPYRRIVVLHITILASGFALGALREPDIGLVILVILKTGFDIYHWRKDEARKTSDPADALELSPEKLRQMNAKFAAPEIEVNGRKLRFDSFRALKDSRQFKFFSGLMRIVGGGQEYRHIQRFIDMKIAEENGGQPVAQPAEAAPPGTRQNEAARTDS